MSVKAGDRVLLPGWGGSPIKVGDEVSPDTSSRPAVCCIMLMSDHCPLVDQEYYLFKDSEILAKIQE